MSIFKFQMKAEKFFITLRIEKNSNYEFSKPFYKAIREFYSIVLKIVSKLITDTLTRRRMPSNWRTAYISLFSSPFLGESIADEVFFTPPFRWDEIAYNKNLNGWVRTF